ncbi:hypothetical protein P4S72_06990 [Vibrio sp. PP-XX7]
MDSDQHHMKALLHQWQQTRKLRPPMLPAGTRNRITDVAGIKVGHVSLWMTAPFKRASPQSCRGTPRSIATRCLAGFRF